MALCAAGMMLMGSTVSMAAERFVQDRFAIGFWVPPPTDERAEEYYRDIARANFTLVIGGFGTDAAKQLELCGKYGLKAVVQAPGPPEDLPEHDACWGYMMVDEPGAGAFPELAKQMDAIYRARPGRFGYINLLPNYASPAMLGTPTYDEHVARFVREVKPQVLSMDHYPLMRPDGDSRQSYCDNLETMRKYSLEADIPFWNFFYSMPFNDRLDPTEAQIRWQIFTAVAFGAKGVLYFCYWTPGKGAAGAGEFPKGGAIVTAEGLRTRHWDEARRINAELKNLGPTLMGLTSTGVYRVNTGKSPAEALAGSFVKSMERVGSDPHSEFIVGTFTNARGERVVLIVNDSYAYTAWPTVEFDAEAARVREVSKSTGSALTVVDDSPELKGLQLSFGPGDARLFLLPPAK